MQEMQERQVLSLSREIPWSMAATPVCLREKFQRQRSLVGYSPWGHKEWDTIEDTQTQTCWASFLTILYMNFLAFMPLPIVFLFSDMSPLSSMWCLDFFHDPRFRQHYNSLWACFLLSIGRVKGFLVCVPVVPHIHFCCYFLCWHLFLNRLIFPGPGCNIYFLTT